MEQYIMALDQGTTSSRCIIYDKKGNAVSISKQEFTQYFPDNGWVEHDAMEIWETQGRLVFAYSQDFKLHWQRRRSGEHGPRHG